METLAAPSLLCVRRCAGSKKFGMQAFPVQQTHDAKSALVTTGSGNLDAFKSAARSSVAKCAVDALQNLRKQYNIGQHGDESEARWYSAMLAAESQRLLTMTGAQVLGQIDVENTNILNELLGCDEE